MSEPILLNQVYKNILSIQKDFFAKLNTLTTENDSDKKLLKKIRTAVLNYYHIKAFDLLQVETDTNYVRIVIDVLENLYENFVATYEQTDAPRSQLYSGLAEIIQQIVVEVIFILNCISFESAKFCNRFIENEGLKILFKYLANPVLLKNYASLYKDKNSKEFKTIDGAMRRIMGSLVCLARVYANYKNNWKECKAAEGFLNYLKVAKDIVDNKIYCCMAIAFVADDDDVDKLPELKDIIPDITKLVGQAAKLIKETENIKRFPMQLDESINEEVEVFCITHMDTEWSIINLLKALYHLAVNDKLKYDIYYKNHMSKYLRLILYNGNATEQEYSLNLIWQLCFDKQIAQDVKEDSTFYEFIQNLTDEKSNPKNLSKYASGIVWLINKKLGAESPQVVDKKPEQDALVKSMGEAPAGPKGKHIMISYNRDSRDLVLQIKAELEKLKLKVWVDIEDISGSSLESMANAIENATCVLMCMTEKYKQSANCRAEAEVLN